MFTMDTRVPPAVMRDVESPPRATTVPAGRSRRLWGAAAMAVVLALAIVGASEWTFLQARQSLDSLGERTQAHESVQRIMRRLVDAESAKRGYLLTQDAAYLRPLADAHADIARGLSALRQHYQGQPELERQTEQVARLTRERLSEIDETLRLQREGRDAAWHAILASGIGREKMEQQRVAAAALLQAENLAWEREHAQVYRTLAVGRWGLLVAVVLALWWALHQMRGHARVARDQEEQAQRLRTVVAQRTAELSELTRYLQELHDSERALLARALHDELGARLTAVTFDLARLRRALPEAAPAVRQRLDHLAATVDEVIGVKRRLREALMPGALQNLGLRPALEMLVAEVSRRAGVAVTLDMPGGEPPVSARVLAYRIVEQALSNVELHAQAQQARVSLRSVDDRLELTVTDDGRGFDATALWRDASGHGLRALRHRVESFGGQFTIDSSADGTAVRASVPCT